MNINIFHNWNNHHQALIKMNHMKLPTFNCFWSTYDLCLFGEPTRCLVLCMVFKNAIEL